MRKLIAIFFLFTVVFVKAQITTYTISASGQTITLPPFAVGGTVLLTPQTGSVTLTGNVSLGVSSALNDGTSFSVHVNPGFTLGGNSFQIFGQTLTQYQLTNGWYFNFVYTGGIAIYNAGPLDWSGSSLVNGAVIIPGTLPGTSLSGASSAGDILVANSSKAFTDVAMTGPVTINDAGVTAITSGAVTDAMITGPVGRAKLADGTANYIPYNNVITGLLDQEQFVKINQGGTNGDFSNSKGFLTMSNDTTYVNPVTDAQNQQVSFLAAGQGPYYFYFPYAFTVTNIQVNVVSTIAGTDSGTVTFQNAGMNAMGGGGLSGGVMVIPMGAATGSGYSSTVTSNGAIAAGSYAIVTPRKTTVGGLLNVQLQGQRVN